MSSRPALGYIMNIMPAKARPCLKKGKKSGRGGGKKTSVQVEEGRREKNGEGEI